MTHDHPDYHQPEKQAPWWKTSFGIAAIFFFAAGVYFLLTEHTAHVVSYLPWLIILACPLMHMFHHGGHGSHSQNDNQNGKGE